MTNEEQQAYYAKREQELLDKCKIKTKEQFLDECRKAGISDDWYAFTCDRSKPVSIDEDTFGFKEGRYIYGAYHYPVPQDLRDRIKSERDFPVRISKELCKILTERLAKNLIEDEFADLCAFLKDLKTELQAAINPKISQSEQKNAFIKALRRAEAGHPAVYNLQDSRSEIIEHNILHQAYDQAGLEWKTK